MPAKPIWNLKTNLEHSNVSVLLHFVIGVVVK